MIYTYPDTDISKTRCYTELRKLRDRGRVHRVDKGVYEVTESGENRLREIREKDFDPSFPLKDNESLEFYLRDN